MKRVITQIAVIRFVGRGDKNMLIRFENGDILYSSSIDLWYLAKFFLSDPIQFEKSMKNDLMIAASDDNGKIHIDLSQEFEGKNEYLCWLILNQ